VVLFAQTKCKKDFRSITNADRAVLQPHKSWPDGPPLWRLTFGRWQRLNTTDQSKRYNAVRGETGEELIKASRSPVNGSAVGAATCGMPCGLSVASYSATFDQAGPRAGWFEAAFGSALAQAVARSGLAQIWFLCRQEGAEIAERPGLANAVIPADRLLEEAKSRAAELAALSPTATRASSRVVQRGHRSSCWAEQPGLFAVYSATSRPKGRKVPGRSPRNASRTLRRTPRRRRSASTHDVEVGDPAGGRRRDNSDRAARGTARWRISPPHIPRNVGGVDINVGSCQLSF